jgi:hypothetical protein
MAFQPLGCQRMRPSGYSERQTYLPTSAVAALLAEPELGSSPTQKSRPKEARCSPPLIPSSCGPKMDLSTCISSPSSAHFSIFGRAILKLCAGGEDQREWNIDQQMPNHSSYSSAASPWGPIRAGRCWAARARCSDDAHRCRPVNQLAALGGGPIRLYRNPPGTCEYMEECNVETRLCFLATTHDVIRRLRMWLHPPQ